MAENVYSKHRDMPPSALEKYSLLHVFVQLDSPVVFKNSQAPSSFDASTTDGSRLFAASIACAHVAKAAACTSSCKLNLLNIYTTQNQYQSSS
jgi:hypothetical protein